MFAWWGRTVYRYRYIVIGVMVALCLGGGLFGMSLGKHVTQSGYYDDSSESVKASIISDNTYGRDRTGHVVAIFKAPDGKTVEDPGWAKKVTDELNQVVQEHPNQIMGWAGYLRAPDSTSPVIQGMVTPDKKYTFVSIPIKGDDDDTILSNYKDVAPALQKLDGGTVQLAGVEPIANALTGTIASDQKYLEYIGLPVVTVVLFLVFGGAVAAGLPVIVGGLTIAGSLGIMRFVAIFGPVHSFAQPVISLIGFGIAIDYGLFVVSRFREEIAEGYDTEAAVRRTVMTAGRTVAFSAALIIVSSASLLVLPQGFVHSLTYAIFAAVGLAAMLSITLLPACLGILGRHVDALGVRTAFRVPFLRNWKYSRAYLNWLADRLQKTKTREEVEAGFWGKLVTRVMKRPLAFAIPIAVGMILLVIPLGNLVARRHQRKISTAGQRRAPGAGTFRQALPGLPHRSADRCDPDRPTTAGHRCSRSPTCSQQPSAISGFTDKTGRTAMPGEHADRPLRQRADRDANQHQPKDHSVRVLQNGLVNKNDAEKKIQELRAYQPAQGHRITGGRDAGADCRIQHPQPGCQSSADGGACCSAPPCC